MWRWGGADSDPRASSLREWFSAADLRLVNLDCALDDTGTPPNPEEYLVSSSADRLTALQDLGVDVVSLANNHSTDFGANSLAATRGSVLAAGMHPVGAGLSEAEARRPVLVTRAGLTVGVLAYASTHPWVGATGADADSYGVARLDPATMYADISRLRADCDCVVVSVHWGKEYVQLPPPQCRALGRGMVDAGANLVLGHHPHVVQGMEVYGQGLIFYSLGNFIFPDYPEQGLRFGEASRTGIVVAVCLQPGQASLEEVLPVVCSASGEVASLAGDDAEAAVEHFRASSRALEAGDYHSMWRAEIRRHELRRLARVIRDEVVAAGWRGGSRRLMSLGWKNLRSVGRSLREIAAGDDHGLGD
ncbi:CapA family protein [Candidatus Latescibacterota bacterium]